MDNTESNTNQHGNCELKDEEIIKALECFKSEDCLGEQCPYYEIVGGCGKKMCSDVYDFVNRQKAEIKSLKAGREALINGQETLQKYIAELKKENERLKTGLKNVTDELTSQIIRIKSEAIKEFAKRLQARCLIFLDSKLEFVDELVKEMESEK